MLSDCVQPPGTLRGQQARLLPPFMTRQLSGLFPVKIHFALVRVHIRNGSEKEGFARTGRPGQPHGFRSADMDVDRAETMKKKVFDAQSLHGVSPLPRPVDLNFFFRYVSGLYMFKIFIPFNGNELFFSVITFLARRNYISPDGFAPAGKGDHMIHGQFLGRRLSAAIMAYAFITLTFPPLRIPEFSGFMTLPLDVFCFRGLKKGMIMVFNSFSFFSAAHQGSSVYSMDKKKGVLIPKFPQCPCIPGPIFLNPHK
jgi:hypothetical protein